MPRIPLEMNAFPSETHGIFQKGTEFFRNGRTVSEGRQFLQKRTARFRRKCTVSEADGEFQKEKKSFTNGWTICETARPFEKWLPRFTGERKAPPTRIGIIRRNQSDRSARLVLISRPRDLVAMPSTAVRLIPDQSTKRAQAQTEAAQTRHAKMHCERRTPEEVPGSRDRAPRTRRKEL